MGQNLKTHGNKKTYLLLNGLIGALGNNQKIMNQNNENTAWK